MTTSSLNCMVFVAHYELLKERFDFMKSQLDKLGIIFKFITQEPEENLFIDSSENRRAKRQIFGSFEDRSLTKAEKSLAWKHLLFLKEASQSSQPCMILEDDAILFDNFVDVVNQLLEMKDWDIIFPGSGCNLRLNGTGLIKVSHPASKCTDSYIVTPDIAKRLISTMEKSIDLAIDWELNYQMMLHNANVYWLEPPIVTQGSQCGIMRSSINGKIENIFRV